jgi:hypothetical protein
MVGNLQAIRLDADPFLKSRRVADIPARALVVLIDTSYAATISTHYSHATDF